MDILKRYCAEYRDLIPFILLMATSFILPTAGHRIVFYALAPVLIVYLYQHRAGLGEFFRTVSFPALLAYLGYFLVTLIWSDAPHEIEPHKVLRDALCVFLFTISLSYVLAQTPAWSKEKVATVFCLLVFVFLAAATIYIYFIDGHYMRYRLEGFGRYENPIYASYLAAFTMLLALSMPSPKDNRINRLRYVFIATLMVFIALTGARGTMVGLAACIVLMAAFGRIKAALVIAALVCLCVLAAIVFGDFSLERLTNRGDGYRFDIWSEAWQGVTEHPVLGHGVGEEPAFSAHPRTGQGWKSTHNAFLGHLYAGGAVGLAAFLILIGNMAWQSVSAYWMQREFGTIARTMMLPQFTCLLLCFSLTASLFNFNHFVNNLHLHWLVFWVPFSMAWALEVRRKRALRLDHPA